MRCIVPSRRNREEEKGGSAEGHGKGNLLFYDAGGRKKREDTIGRGVRRRFEEASFKEKSLYRKKGGNPHQQDGMVVCGKALLRANTAVHLKEEALPSMDRV